MKHETKITAPSIAQAIIEAKRVLGPDVVIVSTEERDGQVILTATGNGTPDKPTFAEILQTDSDGGDDADPTPRPTYADPMMAIRAVCDICEKHQLNYDFCEMWLKELSQDLMATPIEIVRSLAAIVPFHPNWIKELSPDRPIILVGPPGGGKTVTLAKIAMILLSQKRKIKVLTLDTVKAGGSQQLGFYLDVMKQPLLVGEHHLDDLLGTAKDSTASEILLIDTPGINILNRADQDFLYSFSQKVVVPLTLVLPADLNPVDAELIAKNFYLFNSQHLIATRFDTTKHHGGILNAAYKCGLQIAAYSKSPAIIDGIDPLTAELMVDYFTSSR
ncbi:MAG: hypothetical protein NTX76_02185 [Alphaproteobacteria bacterium]|nr:hypothetical protein [Alphaproteobacteria bacterium]